VEGKMKKEDFEIVCMVDGGYAVTHQAAFVGYMIGGKRRMLVGTRMQCTNQLELLLEYADFMNDVSHAAIFVPRKAS
jgi:hypothetical protein